MFNINPDSRFTTEEKLMYNIWEELKRINPQQATESMQTKENIQHEYTCKIEGCTFKTENKGFYLAHCRQHKKEGV